MKTKMAVFAAAAAAFALCAGADELDGEEASGVGEATEAAASGGEAAAEAGGAEGGVQKSNSGAFYLLPFCRELRGKAEVAMPGDAAGWKDVEEGKYYPLGSVYRTVGESSRLKVKFGADSEVTVLGDSSFGTRVQKIGDKARAIDLLGGTVTVRLPNNLPVGMFSVNAPGFTAYNPAGKSRFTYAKTVDGDEAVVRCVTQSLAVKGRHFDVTGMRAANELRIRTSQDNLFTALYGLSGDMPVKLDQGSVFVKDYATGETSVEEKSLDWRLSPRTSVRIHRALPALGERMSVTVMTFDAHGELKNLCAFAEGRPEVNSGELGPTSKSDREELEKRAASLAETREADAEATETQEAEADGGAADSSSGGDSSSSGGDSAFGDDDF